MSQDRLLRNVISVMMMAGYDVSELFAMRPKSFDLIANNDSRIVVLKVISHIDSISEDNARDLDQISRNLGGTPLVVERGPGLGRDGKCAHRRGGPACIG